MGYSRTSSRWPLFPEYRLESWSKYSHKAVDPVGEPYLRIGAMFGEDFPGIRVLRDDHVLAVITLPFHGDGQFLLDSIPIGKKCRV